MIGDDGIAGEGGACGNESRNGQIIDVVFKDEHDTRTDKIKYGKPSPITNDPQIAYGVDGIDGYNEIGIDNPDAEHLINAAHVINNYKRFVRKSMAIDAGKVDADFVQEIDKNEHIQQLYDVLGFVDEMLGIEMQYTELKNEIPLTPYFISLLERTEKYAQNFTESIENRDVLTWLKKTIMRLRTVAKDTAPIVDLPEYLNEIEAHIFKLRHIEIEVNVNDHRYSLNNEIRSVNESIKNQILPEMENIFAEIGSYVSTLIDELFERQYKFEPELVPDFPEIPKNNTMPSFMMLPDDFSSIKSSMIIGSENEATDEWISDSNYFTSGVSSDRVKYHLFIKQLNSIQDELNQFSNLNSESISLTDIASNLAELKSNLEEQLKNYVLDPDDVDRKRDELISLFEEKQSEMEFSKDLSTFFDVSLTILAVPINFYKQTSVGGTADFVNFYEIVNQMDQEAEKVNREIENIYDTILEQFHKIETSIDEIRYQVINKSHFEIDVSKWRTSATIRDVKAFFRKFGNETAVAELLCRSIGKLDDTTTLLFEAYDYIDHLRPVNGNHDSILNDTTKNLERMIEINTILDKYELAVKAFEKQQFPFASKNLLSDLRLPTDLRGDHIEKLAALVIDRFSYLREKVKSADALIGKYDRFVLSDLEFSGSSRFGTFHTWMFSWKYGNTETLMKLLEGEEIELLADINEAKRFNVLKFNEIGIKLKIEPKKQYELDSELEECIVTMAMIGNSDYRCDNKIHSFAVEDNISFTYSFKRNEDGQPFLKNKVYKKIHGKEYFLSPYTTWKIHLQKMIEANLNLTRFAKYEMEVQLFGLGQYVQPSTVLSEFCNELN